MTACLTFSSFHSVAKLFYRRDAVRCIWDSWQHSWHSLLIFLLLSSHFWWRIMRRQLRLRFRYVGLFTVLFTRPLLTNTKCMLIYKCNRFRIDWRKQASYNINEVITENLTLWKSLFLFHFLKSKKTGWNYFLLIWIK